MKDRIFSGPDVEEAVAVAAASLGLPRAELRYVVLEAGTAGGRGLKATLARIAVLVEEGLGRSGTPAPRNEAPAPVSTDPRAGLRATIRSVAEAGDLEVEAALEEGEETLIVRLEGRDTSFFCGADGRGEVLRALEHLLQRLYGGALRPLALRLTGEGFRERRDEVLAEEARRLAAAVRADGQARTMEPQNSYERRIVHVALQGEPGVTTYSVGQGPDRRVTVAPAAPVAPPDQAPETHDGE